ncbi:uncharacterized protein LOC125178328, partial [Hyalella azteca]|uniref:Uncharacterized protein LOC125178328 n=1 Tax=Hyalella azteca TaxID=294128 RepID=A0A979FL75_HYAAZ
MASIIKECCVVLLKLADDALRRGRCPEQILNRVSPVVGKVNSEAIEMVAAAHNIKEELGDDTEDVTVKEEPFLYDEACSAEQLSPPPAPLSCVPCKTEAQVEAPNAHQIAPPHTSTLFMNQCSTGVSAPESGDAAGDADVSGASSSKQRTRRASSQRGLVPAAAGGCKENLHTRCLVKPSSMK